MSEAVKAELVKLGVQLRTYWKSLQGGKTHEKDGSRG